MAKLKYGKAICYSGFRKNQSPREGIYPSYEEVKEDLMILHGDYKYLRMYEPNQHVETVIDVIKKENFDFKLMIGIDLKGEVSNPDCAWGGDYTEEEITENLVHNETQLRDLIKLANKHEDIIEFVSAGNEAVPEWNENLVLPERVLYYVNELKKHTNQLVTYCENCAYWIPKLEEVANAVDVISIHSYPAWAGIDIEKATKTTIMDYKNVADYYKHKPCILTEIGWPTTAGGRGIEAEDASEEYQVKYISEMDQWSEENQVLTFFFEAFDEPWKGSKVWNEPEKHWGIYFENRTPKKIKN